MLQCFRLVAHLFNILLVLVILFHVSIMQLCQLLPCLQQTNQPRQGNFCALEALFLLQIHVRTINLSSIFL